MNPSTSLLPVENVVILHAQSLGGNIAKAGKDVEASEGSDSVQGIGKHYSLTPTAEWSSGDLIEVSFHEHPVCKLLVVDDRSAPAVHEELKRLRQKQAALPSAVGSTKSIPIIHTNEHYSNHSTTALRSVIAAPPAASRGAARQR